LCNLYSITKGQQAIRQLSGAMLDRTGNLPSLPGIFPDYEAPIVRNQPDGRELTMARWGRLIVRRDGDEVRLFTRRGYDWTERYPAIAAAAAKLKARSFTLDSGAVVCDADGVAVFDALHRRHKASDTILGAPTLDIFNVHQIAKGELYRVRVPL
jgi:ATP dependent DNA ligase-like protein